MQVALPPHDALVRQCVVAHGGQVFHTAPDALAAALAGWGSHRAQHSLGNTDASAAAFGQLIGDHGNEAASQVAQTCAWRGGIDRAFEWSERAYIQRDPGLSHSAADRSFRTLREDRRWPPFMKKMGFA